MKCEMCGEEITEDNASDNRKRCKDCLEYFQDCFNDR